MRARVQPRHPFVWSIAAAVLLGAAACGPPLDLKKDLQVVDVRTGWYDAGILNGKNKLIPSVSFALKNVSDHPVGSVQMNLAFWRKGEDGEFDDAYLAGAIDRGGLAPGDQTTTITLRGKVGYTGEQPRAEMLAHSLFVDVTARIFVKRGSAQWTLLGEYPVERHLLTR
jgi:hypothetical protein